MQICTEETIFRIEEDYTEVRKHDFDSNKSREFIIEGKKYIVEDSLTQLPTIEINKRLFFSEKGKGVLELKHENLEEDIKSLKEKKQTILIHREISNGIFTLYNDNNKIYLNFVLYNKILIEENNSIQTVETNYQGGFYRLLFTNIGTNEIYNEIQIGIETIIMYLNLGFMGKISDIKLETSIYKSFNRIKYILEINNINQSKVISGYLRISLVDHMGSIEKKFKHEENMDDVYKNLIFILSYFDINVLKELFTSLNFEFQTTSLNENDMNIFNSLKILFNLK